MKVCLYDYTIRLTFPQKLDATSKSSLQLDLVPGGLRPLYLQHSTRILWSRRLCGFLPLLSVDSHTAVGCGRSSQSVFRMCTHLDVDTPTTDIYGPGVGRLQISACTTYGLIGERQVGFNSIDFILFAFLFREELLGITVSAPCPEDNSGCGKLHIPSLQMCQSPWVVDLRGIWTLWTPSCEHLHW